MALYRLGPSGGSGGDEFDESKASTVEGASVAVVYVWSGAAIDAVQIIHRRRDRLERRSKHGGGGGTRQRLLLRADEFITSITGTYGDVVETLRIHTNQRQDALVAGEREGPASFQYEAGGGAEIIGFRGRSARLLDAIGVVLRPRPGARSAGGVFRCGPAGGNGGRAFVDSLPTGRSAIRSLVVRGDRFVDAISTSWELPSGDIVESNRHGGSGGDAHPVLLARDEYITKITTLHGRVIDYIVISSNKREKLLAVGAHFRVLEPRLLPTAESIFEAPEGTAIVGFLGRAGDLIDGVGVLLRPL